MQQITVKTIEEVWADDKARLKESGQFLEIDWNAKLPTQQDIITLFQLRNKMFAHEQKTPVKPTKSLFKKHINEAEKEQAEIWGTKLLDRPSIEVVSYGSGENLVRILSPSRHV